ncbi:SGNH/GDSL hydrolase family protein [Mesobacillus subterraneus]|uniref:SGNH/GDSL hydrolase family protein n=1 Tax=Mesobacillus subterraneus TaxID=285983 RepID=UPI001CFC4E22|nr:SGNH/GDSL hydrolase family protein [Mesobacillus subterraneus]WLR57452.1 SGNH/GDSL hydrolase family protein [Mesobacillus subterraneus]
MKKYYNRLTLVFSVLSLILMLFSLGWTIQNQFFSNGASGAIEQVKPVKENTEKDGKVVVAIGDSLTRGTGDDSGKGYIGYLVDELKEKSKEKIMIHNFGVKGYRSNQLLDQLKQKEIQRKIQEADYILITIGGNDLFQSGQTFLQMDEQSIAQTKESFLINLESILKEIRTINDSAVIFHMGLYNPFIDLNDSELTTKIVRDWNYDSNQLLDQNEKAVYVPTFDLFQLSVNDYLYTDKFHPNAEGYRLIAERVASLITW